MIQSIQRITIASVAGLLIACGGGGDEATTASTRFQPGSLLTLGVAAEGLAPRTQQWLLHGVTTHGELVAAPAADLVPGALIPVVLAPAEGSDGRDQTRSTRPWTACGNEEICEHYQRMWNAAAVHLGTTDPEALVAALADLDDGIDEILADQARLNLSLSDYLAFYDKLDGVPKLAHMTYAERDLRNMFRYLEKIKASIADCGHLLCGRDADWFTTGGEKEKPSRADVISPFDLMNYGGDMTARFENDLRAALDAINGKSEVSQADLEDLQFRVQQWSIRMNMQSSIMSALAELMKSTLQRMAEFKRNPAADSTRRLQWGGAATNRDSWRVLTSGQPNGGSMDESLSVLAAHDPDARHYSSAQAGRSPAVTLRLRHRPPGAMTQPTEDMASATFALAGQFNATHPEGGHWMPEVRFDTTNVSGTMPGLSATARVSEMYQAGQAGQTVPALRISLQIKLDQVLHSSFRFADFAARGDRGFGFLDYGAEMR